MTMISLSGVSQAVLAGAASANLALHFTWVQQRIPTMHVINHHGLVLTDSGLPCDTFNAICQAQLDHETAQDHIRQAIQYFSDLGRPFSWWLSPGDQPEDLSQYLIAAGLQPAETEQAMAVDLIAVGTAATANGSMSPEGLQIQRVRTAAQLQDFAVIVAANWTPPDEQILRFYELAAPVVLQADSPLRFYVGYLDGNPVVSSELTTGGGVVGLYNICTLENYRRRGFGMALTLQPLLDARAEGYHTAILQASDAGARIYARIGFKTFGQITEYKPSALAYL